MYTVPSLYDAQDKLKPVDADEVALCKEECTPKSQIPCDETVYELSVLLMQENHWNRPTDAFEAAELYTLLREAISENIQPILFGYPFKTVQMLTKGNKCLGQFHFFSVGSTSHVVRQDLNIAFAVCR